LLKAAHVVGLCGFSVILAAGQLLFKAVAVRTPEITDASGLLPLIFQPLLWLAILLYGAATLLWVVLLQQIPLSRAYPFVALGFVLVPVAGALLYGDALTLRFALGTLCILAGIYLAAFAPQ
jgi:undecaprenyl phosphate-alpha-L-ara4N flippase subunit ArnE